MVESEVNTSLVITTFHGKIWITLPNGTPIALAPTEARRVGMELISRAKRIPRSRRRKKWKKQQ